MNKCEECKGCLTPVWVNLNRYMWCDFCDKYYREDYEDRTKWVEIDKDYIMQERIKEYERHLNG